MGAGVAAQPTFVGRQRELLELAAIAGEVADGNRRVVFIGGEPGSGKSRLVSELTMSMGSSFRLLAGGCIAEFGPPYQPFTEPLRALLEDVRSTTAGTDIDAAVLERLELLVDTRPPSDELGVMEFERRLYEAALSILGAVAREKLLVLVLEDVHWAGDDALRLLRFLVERTGDVGLLVLATHRSTPPDRSSALADTMSRLYRLDGVVRLDLEPLSTEDIADFVAAEEGVEHDRAHPAAVELRRRTGGNPFFLRELWRQLHRHGGVVALESGRLRSPDSVRDTIQARLAWLPESERETLQLAAIIGEEFELAVLLAAASADADTTLAGLDSALAAALVEPSPRGDEAYRFCHALTRETVLELMTSSARSSRHAHLVTVIERGFPGLPNRIPRLAHHCAQAQALGLATKAVTYLSESARLATRSLAHADAAELLERAVAISADPEEQNELRLAAGRGRLMSGDFARARQLDDDVVATGTTRQRLRAAVDYETASWRTGEEGLGAAERLLSALRAHESDVSDSLYVRAVAGLGRALTMRGDMDGAARLGRRAVSLARDLSDDDLLADVLQASLLSEPEPRTAAGRLARANELTALIERSGDLRHLGPAAYMRGSIAYLQGRPEDWADAHEDMVRAAQVTGDPFLEFVAECSSYARLFCRGDFAGAQQASAHVLALGGSFGRHDTTGPYAFQTYMLRREMGELEHVRGLVTGDEGPDEHWAPALLALYTELGLRADVNRLLDWFLEQDLEAYRVSGDWPAVLTFLAEAALASENNAAAARLRPLVAEYEGLNLAAGNFVAIFGSADRYLGALDSLLGQGDPDASFAIAFDMDTRMHSPVHIASTLAAWVEHLRRHGARPRRVEDVAQRARLIADPLGLVRVQGSLAAASGSRDLPRSSGLTGRELEVLHLLTEAMSNRQIAQRLVISENTAANHVRSILIKTGCANRTEAALYASRLELTPVPASRPDESGR